MALSAEGFLKKLMDKFDVTAKATKPSLPSTAVYKATSAKAISTGPETVPPGRSSSKPTAWLTTLVQSPMDSITHLD